MKITPNSDWNMEDLSLVPELAEEFEHIDKANRRKRRALRQLTQAHKRLQDFADETEKQFLCMKLERNLYKNDLMRSRERCKDLEKENKDLLFKLENIHSSLLRYEQEYKDAETVNLELRDELKRQLEVSRLLAESNEQLRQKLFDVETDYAITLEQYTLLQKGKEPYDNYADYQ